MKKIKERVLSASSPDVLASPIPQWVPYAARDRAPARRHPLRIISQNLLIMILSILLPYSVFISQVGIAAEEVREGEESKEVAAVKEVVRKLQARYEQTKDLQADFKQLTRIEGFATPLTSSGRVSIKKPGLLRWDYLDPNAEEIYVNRDDVMMYVPEHKQVLVGKLTQMAASQAPLQLLQGVAQIEEEFQVEPTQNNERGEGGIPLVSLVPKPSESESARTLARIVLEVQPKTYYIKSVSIHEISGNISTFQFSGLKPNTGLKLELFKFKVPPGVEVVKAPSLAPPQ
jgi:outer membrane lipoprotein carrier protein